MRVLVTGGAGFIGSHIVDAYIAENHEVAVLDNLSTGHRGNINPAAVFYEVDICFQDQVQDIVKDFRPQVINHHAAQIDVRVSVKRPELDAAVNIIGTINMLQSAVRCGVDRFVFASSGGVLYGECMTEFPASEGAPVMPISPYGFSKLAGEQYLEFFRSNYNLETVILRYANVYGPRQKGGEAGVVAIFCDALRHRQPCKIYGDGEQVRDYVCVTDLVKLNLAVLRFGTGIFNAGTARPTSVNELYNELKVISGASQLPEYHPARPGELQRSAILAERARRVLGWRPEQDLTEGLRLTYASRAD